MDHTFDFEFDAIAIGAALIISFVFAGIPAIVLKYVAGHRFARGNRALVRRSVCWAALVGIVTVVLHIVVIHMMFVFPSLRAFAISLGGWAWTGLGVLPLVAMAVWADYWNAAHVWPLRLPARPVIGFLLVSNLWLLAGAVLTIEFNAFALFPSCVDLVTGELVSTFADPRPANCSND